MVIDKYLWKTSNLWIYLSCVFVLVVQISENSTAALLTNDQPTKFVDANSEQKQSSVVKSIKGDKIETSLKSNKTNGIKTPWSIDEIYTYSFAHQSSLIFLFSKRSHLITKQSEFFLEKVLNDETVAFVPLKATQYNTSINQLKLFFPKTEGSPLCHMSLVYSEEIFLSKSKSSDSHSLITRQLCNESLSKANKEKIAKWHRDQEALLTKPK